MKILLSLILLIITTIVFVNGTNQVLLKINYKDPKCTKGQEASYTLVQDCSIIGRFESQNKTHIVWLDEAHAQNKTSKQNYCNNYHHPTISQKLDSCITNGKSSSIFSITKLNEPKGPNGQCEYYFYPIKDCSNFAYKDVLFNNVCFEDVKTNKFKYTTCNETHTNEFTCQDNLCKKDCKITTTIENGPKTCGEYHKNGTTIFRSFKKSK